MLSLMIPGHSPIESLLFVEFTFTFGARNVARAMQRTDALFASIDLEKELSDLSSVQISVYEDDAQAMTSARILADELQDNLHLRLPGLRRSEQNEQGTRDAKAGSAVCRLQLRRDADVLFSLDDISRYSHTRLVVTVQTTSTAARTMLYAYEPDGSTLALSQTFEVMAGGLLSIAFTSEQS